MLYSIHSKWCNIHTCACCKLDSFTFILTLHRISAGTVPTTKPTTQGGASPPAKADGPFVLVAKRLTDSDVTYGRIILPRVAVEANLKFVLGFRYVCMCLWGDDVCVCVCAVLVVWRLHNTHNVHQQCAPCVGLVSPTPNVSSPPAPHITMSMCTVIYRSHNLPVVDAQGKPWEFIIKSWANGNEKRRVYALEQVCRDSATPS